ncbi:hypothetical protein ACFW16_28305 [Inquilinus sp. NPDC058860]|uniref:hypothetical protein n=1 Tax=Inquilinus sp. NPDC058860 TaxID=3346652 RepID=UPI00367E32EA
MSAALQHTTRIPTTLQGWETLLTAVLLHSDADGDANPIRSFEITPETLALACGLSSDHAEDAEMAFRQALLADRHLIRGLSHGPWRPPSRTLPNCMAPLALSLLVDSLLDGEYRDHGQYRAKLRQWLGVSNSFTVLRGIALMWEELVAWLDRRIDEGQPFRRLLLPTIPAAWTHIGYTRYLSFPTRRDLLFLRKLIERNPKSSNDPTALVRLLDPIIRSPSISFGLKGAFDDFRTALRSGAASVDHRFWRLVARARTTAGIVSAPLVDLRMEFDEDGARSYWMKAAGSSGVSLASDIGSAAVSPTVLESPNLGPSVRRGVLFFRSSGLASWSAAGEPPSGLGPFHLAIADRHERMAAGTNRRFERSGSWHVTSEPVAAGSISDVLKRLGIGNARESVRTVGLVDGVHVGKAWLGLPRFLPRIDGAVGVIDIRATAANGTPPLSCVAGELRAEGSAEGEFAFSDTVTGWSQRATFVPMADVHAEMSGASYALPQLEEWRLGKSQAVPSSAPLNPVWDDHAYACQDVLEALYASSRSGIAEGDAIELIGRAAPRHSWDFLRTLQESTFLDARPRLRWRGHVFTLGRQTLTQVLAGALPSIVVSGAVTARLEMDFRRAVELQGGRAFRRLVEDSMAPPLLGAVGINPATLSVALGWPVVKATVCLDGVVANRLRETKVVGETYQVASAWDWSTGRFQIGARGDGPVSLVRLVHPGGRDHDLYRVVGAQRRTFTSRHAAIVDAHAQAKRPLFRHDDGTIRRLAAEGSLPIEIARVLRLRMLQNGGASSDGWKYALSARDGQWLGGLLPDLIAGLAPAAAIDPMQNYLRGRGARRPVWVDGGISA